MCFFSCFLLFSRKSEICLSEANPFFYVVGAPSGSSYILIFLFFLHFSFSCFSIFSFFLLCFRLFSCFLFLPGQEGSTSTTTRQDKPSPPLSQPNKKGPTPLYESISQTCFVRIMFLRFHFCNIGRDKWINRKRETNKQKKKDEEKLKKKWRTKT